jgi:hypothetical protein
MAALTSILRGKICPKRPVFESFFTFAASAPFSEGYIRSNYWRLNRILSHKTSVRPLKKIVIHGLLFDFVGVKNHKVVINIRSLIHLQQKDFVSNNRSVLSHPANHGGMYIVFVFGPAFLLQYRTVHISLPKGRQTAVNERSLDVFYLTPAIFIVG